MSNYHIIECLATSCTGNYTLAVDKLHIAQKALTPIMTLVMFLSLTILSAKMWEPGNRPPFIAILVMSGASGFILAAIMLALGGAYNLVFIGVSISAVLYVIYRAIYRIDWDNLTPIKSVKSYFDGLSALKKQQKELDELRAQFDLLQSDPYYHQAIKDVDRMLN